MAHRSTFVSLSFILPCLLLSGCQLGTTRQSANNNSKWQRVSTFAERRLLRADVADTNYELILYRLDKTHTQTALGYNKEPQRLEDWAAQTSAPSIVINGAYFTEDYLPTGSFVHNGETLPTQAYEQERSGTITIKNGKLSLYDTNEERVPAGSYDSQFQSFPVLIHRSGQTGISEDSEKLARRTLLAEDKQGNILVIVVDRTPVSLYRLMQILRTSDLDLSMAVNLDGGPSTGLRADLDAFHETVLPLTPLPIVLTFSERPQG